MVDNILWSSEEIKQATGGEITSEFESTKVSIDTRTLQEGALFVAIKGDSLDGHEYVEEAFKQGAAAAIVETSFNLETDKPLVRVKDTLKALEEIGKASRARTNAKIIAVTGSAGKTGTKELLSIAFSSVGKTYASRKSFNNHWGVPLTLANMPKDTEYGVFEIGMNHKGEIEALVKQVRPHVAIITTVEPIHLEFFKNLEEIADAKAEIFTSMEDEGIVILNIDNNHYTRLRQKAEECNVSKIISFGESEEADSRLQDCQLRSDSIKVRTNVLGEKVGYKINIPGKHIALNSLAVLTAVKVLDGSINKAADALRNSEPIEGRGNRIEVTIVKGEPPITIIDESYNANPASMRAAFKVFEMVKPKGEGRRVAVLGDMLELGKHGPKMHMDLANPLLKVQADLVFCCGPLMEALFNVIPPDWQGGYKDNSHELASIVTEAVKPGDVILIKGSNGCKMSYILQALAHAEEENKLNAI